MDYAICKVFPIGTLAIFNVISLKRYIAIMSIVVLEVMAMLHKDNILSPSLASSVTVQHINKF
jgi:general stress protein CsbA